jgi:hypothetical protein
MDARLGVQEGERLTLSIRHDQDVLRTSRKL